MSYDWEMNSAIVHTFKARDFVELNPDWASHSYLTREFGSMFPRLVDSVDGDIARFRMGKMTVEFASQTLAKVKGPRTHRTH